MDVYLYWLLLSMVFISGNEIQDYNDGIVTSSAQIQYYTTERVKSL